MKATFRVVVYMQIYCEGCKSTYKGQDQDHRLVAGDSVWVKRVIDEAVTKVEKEGLCGGCRHGLEQAAIIRRNQLEAAQARKDEGQGQ